MSKAAKGKLIVFLLVFAISTAIMCFAVGVPLVKSYMGRGVIVTFKTNGGEEVGQTKWKDNTEIKLPSPKRLGYALEGWYLDEALETPFNAESFAVKKYETSLTLFAKWAIKTITIDFNSGADGSYAETIEIVYGQNITTLPDSEREGYNFIGWESSDGALLYSDLTVIKNAYKTVNGATYPSLADSDVLIFNARFQIKVFTVTLYSNDGENLTKTVSVNWNEYVPESACGLFAEKQNPYLRVAHYTSESSSTAKYPQTIKSDGIELYAFWQPYIIYDANGGTPVSAVSVPSGSTVILNAASRDGYAFEKWSDGTLTYSAGASFVMPANGIRLTAMWLKSTFYNIAEYNTAVLSNMAGASDAIKVDLSGYQGSAATTFNILSATSSIEIIGRATQIENFIIDVAVRDNSLTLILNGLKILATSGKSAIDATKMTGGSLDILVKGVNDIQSRSMSSSAHAATAVECKTLSISVVPDSGGTLVIRGGNGGGASTPGYAGGNGGRAIHAAGNVTITGTGSESIQIYGGNGGGGGYGDNGDDGRSGGNGGNGAEGIYAPGFNVTVISATVKGGNGSYGGKGGNSTRWTGFGDGGWGGNGGKGGDAVCSTSFSEASASVSGGSGGSRGEGGASGWISGTGGSNRNGSTGSSGAKWVQV